VNVDYRARLRAYESVAQSFQRIYAGISFVHCRERERENFIAYTLAYRTHGPIRRLPRHMHECLHSVVLPRQGCSYILNVLSAGRSRAGCLCDLGDDFNPVTHWVSENQLISIGARHLSPAGRGRMLGMVQGVSRIARASHASCTTHVPPHPSSRRRRPKVAAEDGDVIPLAVLVVRFRERGIGIKVDHARLTYKCV
jgi:hypothetical protein